MGDVLVHFGLEGLGDASLGCMLLLCKHDHFASPRLNRLIHSRYYKWGVLILFNLLTSYITVKAVG